MCPFIEIFGKTIPVYGLCIIVAYVMSMLIWGVCAKKKYNVSFDTTLVIFGMMLSGIIIGGVSLYVFITYPVSHIVKSLMSADFSIMSGMVFYGGLAGGIAGAYIGGRLMHINIFDTEEIFVPLIPFSHALGRVGCLFAGCCHGMEYSGPFAVHITDYVANSLSTATYFPIQAIEAIFDILIMICILIYVRKPKKRGNTVRLYLILYSLLRFALEFFRGDKIRGIYWGLSTSQWISLAIMFLVLVSTIIKRENHASKRDGIC
ncbi:MAG: prolipoprotein diacylglyceryl transferase [Ruminococcaceae bacterium]|nr:prolipoprotein diacylglyceryl transferase [Oscillospiraceae bacterium]